MYKTELKNEIGTLSQSNHLYLGHVVSYKELMVLIDNLDNTPTTEQAWKKIAKKYDKSIANVEADFEDWINSGNPKMKEKPEIPKFVAVWIRGLRILDVTDLDIIGLYFSKEIEKKCEQWITDNFNDFIKALVNGYTEKEPAWVVLKDAQYFHAFTGEYDESEGFEYVLAMYEGHAHTFADKQKAEAAATLVDGTVKEWSE